MPATQTARQLLPRPDAPDTAGETLWAALTSLAAPDVAGRVAASRAKTETTQREGEQPAKAEPPQPLRLGSMVRARYRDSSRHYRHAKVVARQPSARAHTSIRTRCASRQPKGRAPQTPLTQTDVGTTTPSRYRARASKPARQRRAQQQQPRQQVRWCSHAPESGAQQHNQRQQRVSCKWPMPRLRQW